MIYWFSDDYCGNVALSKLPNTNAFNFLEKQYAISVLSCVYQCCTANGPVSLINCWPISPFPSNWSEIGQYEPPLPPCHQRWVQHRETPAQPCLYWAHASSQLLVISPGGMAQLVSQSQRVYLLRYTQIYCMYWTKIAYGQMPFKFIWRPDSVIPTSQSGYCVVLGAG